jgi:sulfonate transport system permease protein
VSTPARERGTLDGEPPAPETTEPSFPGREPPQVSPLVTPRVEPLRADTEGASTLLRSSGPVLLLAAWFGLSHGGIVGPEFLAPPEQVLSAGVDLVRTGALLENLVASLARVIRGLTCGLSVGLVLGTLTGLSRLADALVDPLMQMLRTLPFLALLPLLVLWFGIGEAQKTLLIALATCFPMYLNTHSGVQGADPRLLEAGRVFGLSRAGELRYIVAPAALPQILVGLRQSLGVALVALIVAEQSNAPRGIGFLMLSASQFFQADVLLVCVVLYALWGFASDQAVRGLARILMPWRRRSDRA